MKEFIITLNSNPYLNFLFLVLAIIGIVTSFVLYLIGIRQKKPLYQKSSERLISRPLNAMEGLDISYCGRKINDLVVSRVSLWNSGKDPINRLDIAPKDHIRLVISEGDLLGAQIEYEQNKINNFSIDTKEVVNTVIVNFDYVGMNEGAIIKIYHNSTIDEAIEVKGTVKGCGEFQLAKDNNYYTGKYLDLFIGLLESVAKIKYKWIRKICKYIIFTIFLPIIILPLMCFQAIDLFMFYMFRKIPKQYRVRTI